MSLFCFLHCSTKSSQFRNTSNAPRYHLAMTPPWPKTALLRRNATVPGICKPEMFEFWHSIWLTSSRFTTAAGFHRHGLPPAPSSIFAASSNAPPKRGPMVNRPGHGGRSNRSALQSGMPHRCTGQRPSPAGKLCRA